MNYEETLEEEKTLGTVPDCLKTQAENMTKGGW